MKDNMLYIVLIVIFPILFYFIIKRQDECLAGSNKRRRFSMGVTILVFTVTFVGLSALINNIENISTYLSVRKGYIFIGILLIFLFVLPLIFNLMYEPINKTKLNNEIEYRKRNRKSWIYYIIKFPMSSTYSMLVLPPVRKFGKITEQEMSKFHCKELDTPPQYIQWCLILIIFIITGIGSIISDCFFRNEWGVVYWNISFFPFLLTLLIIGRPIIKLLDMLENALKIKINEMIKFLCFNLLIILIANVIWELVSIKG